MASGVHILMSDNLASCVWARLSWHGRNGNYDDLRLDSVVATIIFTWALKIFFEKPSKKSAEWLIIILSNKKKSLTLIWTNWILFAHLEHFRVCRSRLSLHDRGVFFRLVLVCPKSTCVCLDALGMCLLIECVFTFARWGEGSDG